MSTRFVTHVYLGFFLILVVSMSVARDTTQDELSGTLAELRAQASTAGLVRVIVTVRPDPCRNINLDAGSTAAAVIDAKARLTKIMTEADAPLVEPIEGQPMIVMELSAGQLDQLVATGLVKTLQVDSIDRGF